MATTDMSLGLFATLPAEILENLLQKVQANDDTGMIQSGVLEFAFHPKYMTLHHVRTVQPRIKEVGSGYLQTHRAFCLVSKRMRVEAEATFFRNAKVSISFGWNLTHRSHKFTRSSTIVGQSPVHAGYLVKHVRNLGFCRFVPLHLLKGPSFWLAMNLRLPWKTGSSDLHFQRSIPAAATNSAEDRSLQKAYRIKTLVLEVGGWVQALAHTGELSIEGFDDIVNAFLADDEDMQRERRKREKQARLNAFDKAIREKVMEEDSRLQRAGLSLIARQQRLLAYRRSITAQVLYPEW